jgi:hypothetical protein
MLRAQQWWRAGVAPVFRHEYALLMKIPGLHIALLFALGTFAIWAYINRPEAEPEWPHRVQGFAFSPYQENENAMNNEYPTREEIIRDLDLRRPVFQPTAAYGHFGRSGDGFTWEMTNRVDGLKSALGL